VPPAAARQAEVAWDYLKRAARISELNGHLPGSDGPMATALKRHNGGRVLVFVVGAFAEMSEDVSRICDINAQDLARTHVSYYNGDAKRTKGMNSNSNQYSPIWHRSQCCGVKWGARVLRVRSVSREEVWASVGVQGAWVGGCGCEAD